MSSDWNVDDAVNEVMAWIHDGSALPFLKLPDDLKLKTTYHDRFQRAKERGIDWNLARKRVLPLAYMVGALATMLAAVDLCRLWISGRRLARRAAGALAQACRASSAMPGTSKIKPRYSGVREVTYLCLGTIPAQAKRSWQFGGHRMASGISGGKAIYRGGREVTYSCLPTTKPVEVPPNSPSPRGVRPSRAQ
jgi:hypothetical protein